MATEFFGNRSESRHLRCAYSSADIPGVTRDDQQQSFPMHVQPAYFLQPLIDVDESHAAAVRIANLLQISDGSPSKHDINVSRQVMKTVMACKL
jgi:hypothetical protein